MLRKLAVLGAFVIGALLLGQASGADVPLAVNTSVLRVTPTGFELQIPNQCKIDSCVWTLFVNEPFLPGEPVVGTQSGSTPGGLLDVAFPSDFCGTVQADALLNGVKSGDQGKRVTLDTCSPPTTTTTTTVPPTTTTTVPPVQTGPPVLQPPSPGGPVPGQGPTLAPPEVVQPQIVSAPHTMAPAAAQAPELPFTGIPVAQMLGIGFGAVGVGWVLKRKRLFR